ncbi:mycofactocin-coupled SDR family oxidoreductase [Trujillonella endophytica]|uniref:SDR family mycofactocin-dependent oxidoreductase n=1 Tax=Trujillonella endophytica TaxID=673521 RepID=A0A1H8QTZ0_9ACTN|nr:mycofactocin-coupled SDR family oxidoreductase [Trujillella endophytica]SEO57431.1 SDR family mycofactocin-dependent oxidoreductase [Trujillella endophytica]
MGRLEGKVAFITGAARGQGRSHAVRLAQEGADIIGIDLCRDLETAAYSGPDEADLAETVRQVEALDRRMVARVADVRDLSALEAVVDEGLSQLGHIDIVLANAGISTLVPGHLMSEEVWDETIGINLTGVWKTMRATIPGMLERGQGGSIVLTSSTAGISGIGNTAHYSAAKAGLVGLMEAFAIELAPHMIRVNTVHPSTTDTLMMRNQATFDLFAGHAGATEEEVLPTVRAMNALPIAYLDPIDISNAVLFLASDEARYITGTKLKVDAGGTLVYKMAHPPQA